METAHYTKEGSTPQTPLVNLFAYIRDLFMTGEPELRFDTAPYPWWSMDVWQKWRTHHSSRSFYLELEDPEKPFLRLNKSQVEDIQMPQELEGWVMVSDQEGEAPLLHHKKQRLRKFEDDDTRVLDLAKFSAKVEGKAIEDVGELEIPSSLRGWVHVHAPSGKIELEKKDMFEPFEGDEHRVEVFQTFKSLYDAHHQEKFVTVAVNTLYEHLHQMYYELRSQPEKQLTLSFGLVSGVIGGENYHSHLFHIPLKLQLQKQEISLATDAFANPLTIEQAFSPLFSEHFKGDSEYAINERQLDVLKKIDAFHADGPVFSFEEGFVVQNYYQVAKEILRVFPSFQDNFLQEGQLNWTYYPFEIDKGIRLSFSPVIHIKSQDTQVHIAKDASKIMAKINELMNQGKETMVPDFFRKLFSIEKKKNPFRIVHRNRSASLVPAKVEEVVRPKRFLFPLPYNKEQLTIAERLLEQDAVTVKGPPGTGKSHTIANITAHYAAEGKSVLIVSKNAKALEVIRGKLPQEMRHLAVSLVSDDFTAKEMKYAIDSIKDHLSQSYSPEKVDKLEAELDILDKAYDRTMEDISKHMARQNHSIALFNPRTGEVEERNLVDWAKFWAKEQPRSRWLDIEDPSSFELEEIAELWFRWKSLGMEMGNHQANLHEYSYVNEGSLPQPIALRQCLQEMKELEKDLVLSEWEKVHIHLADRAFFDMFDKAKEALSNLTQADGLLQHPDFRIENLKRLFRDNKELLHNWREPQWNHHFSLGELESEDPDIVRDALLKLIDRFGEKDTLGFVAKKTLPSIQKKFFSCSIDHLPVDRLRHLELLSSYVEHLCERKRLKIVIGNFYRLLGIEIDYAETSAALRQLEEILSGIETLQAFNIQAELINLPTLELGKADLNEKIAFIEQLHAFQSYKELQSQWEQAKNALLLMSQGKHHPLLGELYGHIRSGNIDAYEKAYTAYFDQKNTATVSQERAAILRQLEGIMPKTAKKLENDAFFLPPKKEEIRYQLASDIFAIQLHQYLRSHIGPGPQQDDLFERLHIIQAEREDKISRLVVYKSWLNKTENITDEQKSALSAWRNDLVNIGKGKGKNTKRNMESAVENMRKAKGVVPIWIMQQDTAIRFFPEPTPGQFDLLIIDEASQCDISMLNLIFRAKKSMVVGDENQTSVSTLASLFPIHRTNQILDRYLVNHPFRQQFNINNRSASIYTLSGVIYPNIISLREHFRCRPEIIGFSNKYVYNKQVIPLKTATESLYGKPVEVYYVEDPSTGPKSAKIVDQVESLVVNLVEEYEAGNLPKLPSVGVLCLESSNEVHREYMLRVLAKNPKIRQYEDELQLLIGTSRKFQGDERDIMILTCTAKHKFSEDGTIRPPRAVTGEEMMRIYNVATSRAREKSVLLHSIPSEAVAAMKPNCYRKMLIDYYSLPLVHTQEVKSKEELMAKIHDPFQSELGSFLYEHGSPESLRPNFQIGEHSVDFALVHEGKKLAIVCDDSLEEGRIIEQTQYQLVLERVGWKFLRVQAVDWYYREQNQKQEILNWIQKALA